MEIIHPLEEGVSNIGGVNVVNGPHNDRDRKRSIVRIMNDDGQCMMRSIIVSWTSAKKISNAEWNVKTNSLSGTRVDKAFEIRLVSEHLYKDLTNAN